MAELGAVELALITKDLSEAEKMIFQTQFASVRKDRGTAVILAIFLYDRIWLGDTAIGILKLLTAGLCGIWTIIDLFTVASRCDEYNRMKAQDIAASLRVNSNVFQNGGPVKPDDMNQAQKVAARREVGQQTQRVEKISAGSGTEPGLPVGAVSTSWSLHGLSGPLAGASVELTMAPLVIGRDPKECNLIIQSEQGISRKHCIVRIDSSNRYVLLEDCGSSNGTFLANGRMLEYGTIYTLENGDKFYIANPNISFEVRNN